jgi:hypothetical protein
MANPNEIDDFVRKFTVAGLPVKAPAKPQGMMNVKAKEWQQTWGKYYNSDGTKK